MECCWGRNPRQGIKSSQSSKSLSFQPTHALSEDENLEKLRRKQPSTNQAVFGRGESEILKIRKMKSSSWILRASFSLLVFYFVKGLGEAEGRSQSYLETNELTPKMDARSLLSSLPICGGNSICGYLQANARGINYQPICACAKGTCPSAWDPHDGYSVTQGSDQYKYCGKAPKLSSCEPLMTAYTSKSIHSKSTERKLAQVDHILCKCPESHNYELAGQPNFGDVDLDSEMVDVSYVCSALPSCDSGDICKFISETATSYLVNRKCDCASNLRCPTLNEIGASESVSMGSGLVHTVRCQR